MANEAEERERQRVLDLVHEDLRKEIPVLLADVHEESLRHKGTALIAINSTTARFASLLGGLYIRADIQTRKVINLTRALVALTVALLLFTIYLSYDAYLKNKRIDQEQKDRAEKSKSDVDTHLFTNLL